MVNHKGEKNQLITEKLVVFVAFKYTTTQHKKVEGISCSSVHELQTHSLCFLIPASKMTLACLSEARLLFLGTLSTAEGLHLNKCLDYAY